MSLWEQMVDGLYQCCHWTWQDWTGLAVLLISLIFLLLIPN
jgi:hypothetical protein